MLMIFVFSFYVINLAGSFHFNGLFKESAICFIDFSLLLLLAISLISVLIFILSFLLLAFNFFFFFFLGFWSGSSDNIDLCLILFSNVSIYCYELLAQHCISCITQILIYFHFHSVQSILIFPENSFFTYGLSGSFIFQLFEDFTIIFLWQNSNLILVVLRKYILVWFKCF